MSEDHPLAAWRGWVLVAGALVAWESGRHLAAVPPVLMPPVMAVVRTLVLGLIDGSLTAQLLRSLAVIVAGTGTAMLTALVAVPLASVHRWARDGLAVVSGLLHPLPGIAVLPVVVLWVGVGTPAVFVVIVHSIFWPLVTNLLAGYRALPRTWQEMAANYRVGPLRYLLFIALPGLMPYLLAGLRIAWARSWRALISAELVFGALAGGGGVGWYLASRRAFMDSEGLFAGILLVMIVGSAVESLLFRMLERRTVERWGMQT